MAGEALFGRTYAVTVGKPGEAGKRWKDLRVRFKVEKSGVSVPNHLEHTLYNLSAGSRADPAGASKITGVQAARSRTSRRSARVRRPAPANAGRRLDTAS